MSTNELTSVENTAITLAKQVQELRTMVDRYINELAQTKLELAQQKVKFEHFINPDTKPQSIDDATSREWDLCARNDYLRGQLKDLDLYRGNCAELEKRCEGMAEMFKAAAEQREKSFEVGQAALLKRATDAEAERDRLLHLLTQIQDRNKPTLTHL